MFENKEGLGTQGDPENILAGIHVVKKRNKMLNDLIHIYSHKVLFNSLMPTSPKREKSKLVLPKIEGDFMTKIKHVDSKYLLPRTNSMDAKAVAILEKKRQERESSQGIRDKMERIRQQKLEKAKEMKNENRLIRENILIFKEKLLDHNKQLNRLVKHEKVLSKNSIEKGKEEKKQLFKELRKSEFVKEKEDVEMKENEFIFWKNQYENSLSQHS